MSETLFDTVTGRQREKLILSAALREGSTRGGSTNVLLVGPGGVGKSMLLGDIERSVDGAKLIDGETTSPARLTSILADDPDVLLIDEIDALDDFDALSIPLEAHRVVKETAHESIDVDISTQVIAAANDRKAIPSPILDRFEVVEVEEYDVDEYYQICTKVLPAESGGWISGPDAARDVADWVLDDTGEPNVRRARAVARLAEDAGEAAALSAALAGTDPDDDLPSIDPFPDPIERACEVAEEVCRRQGVSALAEQVAERAMNGD